MRRWLTVRNTLGAIGGVGTATLIAFAGGLWADAWRQYGEAERILQITAIEDALLESSRAWSRERDLVHVGLNGGAALSLADRRELTAARDRADRTFSRALALIGRNPANTDRGPARRATESRFERVRVIRALIDEALRQARAERDRSLVRSWFPAVTDLIMASATLREAIRFQTAPEVSEARVARNLKDAAWVMAEFAARESTLIAGTIAAGEPLVLARAQDLAAFRGHLEEAWRYVSARGRDATVAPAVTAAIERVGDGYFTRFEEIRAPVIEAGMLGDDYPLSLAVWRQRAAAAIGPIHALGEAAGRLSRRLTDAQAVDGLRDLAIASAVLFATIAMGAISLWIVVAWVVRPLGRITVAMTTLASGDETIKVPATEAPGEIGEMARAVAVFKEAAEAYATEIERANEVLEDRVAERTGALVEARDEALAASKAKSQFLANMSHELRTPLTIIMSQAALMREQAELDGAPRSSEQIEDLETIMDSSRHLLQLIDQVLDLSKVEAGKMEFSLESFDVGEMAEDLLRSIRPIAERNGNALVLQRGSRLGRMRSDVTKLRQALYNLLSNACKFTHDGEVRFEIARETTGQSDSIVFVIRDTGIGMSAAEAGIVFEAFTQADASTTREYGGTGLGLTITRQICRMLGGDISVESEPGRGSGFTMRLPADAETASGVTPEMDGCGRPEDESPAPAAVPIMKAMS